jgi:hypothetical protein
MALLAGLGASQSGLELTGEDGRSSPRVAVDAAIMVKEEKWAAEDESVVCGQYSRECALRSTRRYGTSYRPDSGPASSARRSPGDAGTRASSHTDAWTHEGTSTAGSGAQWWCARLCSRRFTFRALSPLAPDGVGDRSIHALAG